MLEERRRRAATQLEASPPRPTSPARLASQLRSEPASPRCRRSFLHVYRSSARGALCRRGPCCSSSAGRGRCPASRAPGSFPTGSRSSRAPSLSAGWTRSARRGLPAVAWALGQAPLRGLLRQGLGMLGRRAREHGLDVGPGVRLLGSGRLVVVEVPPLARRLAHACECLARPFYRRRSPWLGLPCRINCGRRGVAGKS